MPSLTRFLRNILIVVGLFYGFLYALDVFIDPQPQTISVRVPTSVFKQAD